MGIFSKKNKIPEMKGVSFPGVNNVNEQHIRSAQQIGQQLGQIPQRQQEIYVAPPPERVYVTEFSPRIFIALFVVFFFILNELIKVPTNYSIYAAILIAWVLEYLDAR